MNNGRSWVSGWVGTHTVLQVIAVTKLSQVITRRQSPPHFACKVCQLVSGDFAVRYGDQSLEVR